MHECNFLRVLIVINIFAVNRRVAVAVKIVTIL